MALSKRDVNYGTGGAMKALSSHGDVYGSKFIAAIE